MNVNSFCDDLNILQFNGPLLNMEQISLLENSLILLQSANKFREVFFWGVINGLDRDYFIAFGYTDDILENKRFFYSTDCLEWLLMPPANPKLMKPSLLIADMFVGDPYITKPVLLDPKFIKEDDGSFSLGPRKTKRLKEEDRLACIVHKITDECASAPRGLLYRRCDGKCVINKLFRGLKSEDAAKLKNFKMFRMPRNKWNSNLMNIADYNYPIDNFDTADGVVPKNSSFGLTIDNRSIVNVKSLHWPGMCSYHRSETNHQGFVYFGNGKLNFDITFMV